MSSRDCDEIEMTTTALLEDENVPSEEKFRQRNGFVPQQQKSIRFFKKLTKTTFLNLVPILKWLPTYNIKENVLHDVIAGLTVSVLQIPHGLAFAPLAYQEPVVGLYMAVFPIIMYIIFGTSRHLSLGMMGILIIMVGAVVEDHYGTASDLEIAITVTFTVGLWQFLLGCFQLGSLCVVLSDSLVSGLTSAAALHIIVIQMKEIFGISAVMASGPLKIFSIAYEVLSRVHEANYVSVLIAGSFFTVLFTFNEAIKPKIAKKCRIPIPMEFILIVTSIILSHFLGLKENYGVKNVGSIPAGFPTIIAPNFRIMTKIVLDSLVIALVSITFNVSLARVFAKKGNYTISDNQELIAYGLSNIVGGFFQCLPVSGSLSRTMVQFAVGGKTEFAHVVSVTSVLFILLFLGPFFSQVSLCVLAAIVMATLKGLLIQIADFPAIWRSSRLNGFVWLTTFVSVVLLDLFYGIVVGVLASVITLVVRECQHEVVVVNELSGRFLDSRRYPSASPCDRLLLVKIFGTINFFNCSKVSRKVLSELDMFWDKFPDRDTYVVVDFSAVPSLDPSAVAELKSLFKVVDSRSCQMFFSSCSAQVYKTLELCGFFDEFPRTSVMISLNAAVDYLKDTKIL